MGASRTYYDVLGVEPNASDDAIRSAFRSAAKQYHPDLSPSYVQKLRATVRMQELNEAYAVLRNPEQRRAYDRTLGQREVEIPDSRGAGGGAPRYPSSFEGTGAVVPAGPAGPRSRGIDPVTFWMVCVWMIVSVGYAYSLSNTLPSPTWSGLLLRLAIAIAVTPLLLVALVAVLGIPIAILWGAFTRGFERRRGAPSGSRCVVVRDLIFRLLGLAVVMGVGTAAWHLRFTPDLLFVALLAVGGGVLGEIAAMIGYLFRRSVLYSTETMLGEHLVPSGADSNGA